MHRVEGEKPLHRGLADLRPAAHQAGQCRPDERQEAGMPRPTLVAKKASSSIGSR